MLSADRLLVIAPHADDESLGCGGLLTRLSTRESPAAIHLVLASASTVTVHQGGDAPWTVPGPLREAEFEEAAGLLRATVRYLDLETRRLEARLDELVVGLERQVRDFAPDCVLLPYPSTHQDHVAAYRAALAALRPRNCPGVRTVLAYEAPNYPYAPEEVRFLPNVYVRLSAAEAEGKLRLCSVYRSQRLDTPAGRAEVWRQMARRGLEVECQPPHGLDEAAYAETPLAEACRLIRGFV